MAFLQRCFLILWICLAGLTSRAQDSGQVAPVHRDTVIPVVDSAARAAHRDSVRRRRALRDTLAARALRDSLRLSIADSLRRDSLRAATHSGGSITGATPGSTPGATIGSTPGATTGTTPDASPRATPGATSSASTAPPRPDTRAGTPKIQVGRDLLFYVVLCLALWLGILKSGYHKYYDDLFTVFFRSSLRQHQIREQLLQARLPSLLYNLFFVGCAGTFLYLLAVSYAVRLGHPDWQLWIGAIAAVALLYVVKFVGLKLSGWVFGMTGAVDTYIFIVFLVNKILGVALFPIVVLLAFAKDPLQSAAATLGVMLVVGMLIYRFIRSYRPVWEEVQMSRFHFFLYLCAFEIAPLLLIYKTMLKLL